MGSRCAVAAVTVGDATVAMGRDTQNNEGLVTYVLPVEVIAAEIKMELSDDCSYWSRPRDQDELVTNIN